MVLGQTGLGAALADFQSQLRLRSAGARLHLNERLREVDAVCSCRFPSWQRFGPGARRGPGRTAQDAEAGDRGEQASRPEGSGTVPAPRSVPGPWRAAGACSRPGGIAEPRAPVPSTPAACDLPRHLPRPGHSHNRHPRRACAPTLPPLPARPTCVIRAEIPRSPAPASYQGSPRARGHAARWRGYKRRASRAGPCVRAACRRLPGRTRHRYCVASECRSTCRWVSTPAF